MKLFYIVLSLAMLVALAGCGPSEPKKSKVIENDGYTLIMQEDCTHNVVCYRFRGFEGMSCVKMEGEAKSCKLSR